MKSYVAKIPQPALKKDLTIIYKEGEDKLHEIKISKDNFFNSLRTYEKKKKEIELNNMIYIEENIPFTIFKAFINTITSYELELNEENYETYYYLSIKYDYREVRSLIEEFMATRPDISSSIDSLLNGKSSSSHSKTGNDKETENGVSEESFIKEEIIAKNLDTCIINGHLKRLPIKNLARILNLPKRVIKDHHLLFSFVIDILKTNLSKKLSKEEKEALFVIPGCLDFLQMNNEEIKMLIQVENSNDFISPKNATKRIVMSIEKEEEMNKKIEEIIHRIDASEEQNKQNFERLEKNLKKTKLKFDENLKNEGKRINDEIGLRFDEIQQESNKQQKQIEKKIEEQNLINDKNERRIDELKTKQAEFNTQIEKAASKINKINNSQANIKTMVNTIQTIQDSIACNNGIFQYLLSKYNSNILVKNLIKINGNSFDLAEFSKLPKIIDSSYESNYWYSENKENSFIKIEFINSLVRINSYWIRFGYGSVNSSYFTSWVLKGLTFDNKEVILDKVVNSTIIALDHLEANRKVLNKQLVKSVQLIMIGKNKSGDYIMRVRNFEIYGFYNHNPA